MIRYFAEHPTAANLLMVAFLAVGAMLAPTLKRATFPRIQADTVQVTVLYPGAAPETVEDAICRRIEDAVDAVDGVEEITCESTEGRAVATVEMREGGDLDRFFGEIRTEIDAIDDFPDRAEEPVLEQLGRTDAVGSVAVTGPADWPALHSYARDVKERMDAFGGIPRTELTGFPDRQLRIELRESFLRAYDLSLADIARTLERQNTDLPAGEIEAADREILIRVDDERRSTEALTGLVIVSDRQGGALRLGDIATITDRFETDGARSTFDGRPAAFIDVTKTPAEDLLRVTERVEAFIDAEEAAAPDGVGLTLVNELAPLVRDRLSLLVVNGVQGLLLVCFTMWLFFGTRFAFWIVMGLPVAFLGGLAAMALMGLTLNMLTMVGLLMVVGLLMDDAIVISENIAARREAGRSGMEAAAEGALEVLPGIASSFLTTLCIFGALGFLEGDLGQTLRVVPIVMITVLAISLVEAFLILPSHLGHALHGARAERGRVQRAANGAVRWLGERGAVPLAALSVRFRYLTAGLSIAALVLAATALAAGVLKFTPFPDLDGDRLEARILLPQGVPLEATEAVVDRVTAAMDAIEAEYGPEQPGGRLVENVTVTYGQNADAYEQGDHVATVSVDLLTSEERSIANDPLFAEWRARVGSPPGVTALTFTEPNFGPAGRPFDLRLKGSDLDALKAASAELRGWLGSYEGVVSLMDDLRPGKPEIAVSIAPQGQLLGFTSGEIADQVRAAFFGTTIDDIQVGPISYEIDLRMAAADRDRLTALRDFMVRAPDGTMVPLPSVATLEETRGWARINRIDGARAVSVQGDVDPRVANAAEILADTRARFLPGFLERHPGVRFEVAGQDAETAETRTSMLMGFGLGLVGVFLVLSFQFRSFVEPVVVMVLIPFALIGAVVGHLGLGIDFTMPSMLGFAALAGVVVNDSILLVHRIKTHHRPGAHIAEAVAPAVAARFRAILLTSLTTAAGLLPLLSETSLQAQILIPLVASLAFGLMAATAMVIFVVPAFYTILDDFGLTTLAAERREARRAGGQAAARAS
ncbi:MAG: efflux RND transporter permease subunit [Pseudomonadota bacterium]